ncbi:MAG: hypothetical protein AAF802_25655, partial [Planctomycetota bacterium]
FLHVNWEDYWELLKWTAQQSSKGTKALKGRLAKCLGELGIDASMWRDMVWDWQRFFGKSACIGSPNAMKEHAEQAGLHHHRGQASLRACFTN